MGREKRGEFEAYLRMRKRIQEGENERVVQKADKEREGREVGGEDESYVPPRERIQQCSYGEGARDDGGQNEWYFQPRKRKQQCECDRLTEKEKERELDDGAEIGGEVELYLQPRKRIQQCKQRTSSSRAEGEGAGGRSGRGKRPGS